MWLISKVSVSMMLGNEVFEQVQTEVGVNAQYTSPSCLSLIEAVRN